MKFILKVLGLIALLGIAYVLIYNLWPSEEARGRMSVDRLTNVSPVAPTAQQNQNTQSAPPQVSLKDHIVAAAKSSQVQVIGTQFTGAQAQVTIQWKSGNFAQGGEFLDYLITHGAIRDFDEGKSSTYTNSSGQYVHTMDLTLIPY